MLYRLEDSREGWADLLRKASMSLMTGAGIGIDYSDVRPSGSRIKKTGGHSTGPVAVMQMVNECGRHIMQGGNRRSAIWAGLKWSHADCEKFILLKDWDEETVAKKAADINAQAPLDMTNVSILLDNEFFFAYENKQHPKHDQARHIYDLGVSQMIRTAEPGFSIDIGENAGETLRNACSELTSSDDSDICNLGSLNMSRFTDKEDFADAVKHGTLFLLAGTVYSDVPHEEVRIVREKNRRLGLGLMGVHDWLLQRSKSYAPDPELARWLDEYAHSGDYADEWAEKHNLSKPVKTRAIAPTGTIGIVAETTTGIEPLFCVAYKRRFKTADVDGNDLTQYQYVIDPTAERLIQEQGIDPNEIEDAYSLSYNVEKRVAFQAWVQGWVDHAISSTVNLPYPITDPDEVEDFAKMLYGYLPKLRGITCYPDGARSGQPLTAVPYAVAHGQTGVTFKDSNETCKNGSCGE